MSKASSTQTTIDALNEQYKTYIGKLRTEWLAKNQVNSRDVYEVMRPEERRRVDDVIVQWTKYVTPFAEAWWKERGYGIIWPENNSKPMKLFRLEVA